MAKMTAWTVILLAAGLRYCFRRHANNERRTATAPRYTASRQSPKASDDRRQQSLSDWSDPYWEPFKIALGTLYALCLQRGFDSVYSYFQRHPVPFDTLLTHNSPSSDSSLVVALLAGYVLWLSLFFLYNARLYMLLPERPARRRIMSYAGLTLSFGAFYFFGASLGPPSRVQVFAVCLIISADLMLPVYLGVVTQNSARVLWAFRDLGELAVAISVLTLTSDHTIKKPIWVYLLLAVLIIQLFIAPREFRYQLRSRETL
ncbi:hypothetical protein [Actinoallomurus sp. CA-142502]|uniref:hypothetical protein n=1 Tax=Actinoallomurus sp. CA-142502 TaxID=3239885 RepID=UPI003D946168